MLTYLALSTTDGLVTAGDNAGFSVSQTAPQLVGLILTGLFSALGILFLVLIIYGGVTWMTSAGNEKAVEKAKNIIIRATIGLVIVLASYAISRFIIGNLECALNGGIGGSACASVSAR